MTVLIDMPQDTVEILAESPASAIAPCIALPPDLTSMDGGNAARLPGAVAAMQSFAMVNGTPFNTLPDDLYIPPDALEVLLDTFEGPLDLLLYLIRRQNLDIVNIPIAQITHQYIVYIQIMGVADRQKAHFRSPLGGGNDSRGGRLEGVARFPRCVGAQSGNKRARPYTFPMISPCLVQPRGRRLRSGSALRASPVPTHGTCPVLERRRES